MLEPENVWPFCLKNGWNYYSISNGCDSFSANQLSHPFSCTWPITVLLSAPSSSILDDPNSNSAHDICVFSKALLLLQWTRAITATCPKEVMSHSLTRDIDHNQHVHQHLFGPWYSPHKVSGEGGGWLRACLSWFHPDMPLSVYGLSIRI